MKLAEIRNHLLENSIDADSLIYCLNSWKEDHPLELVRTIDELLRDSNEKIRAEAVWMVETIRLRDPVVVKHLRDAVDDPNLYISSHATLYLMEERLAALPYQLIAVFENEDLDSHTRSRAALLLAIEASQESEHVLIERLTDQDSDLVWNVIHALEQRKETSTAVLKALRDIQDSDVRATSGGLSLAQKAREAIGILAGITD